MVSKECVKKPKSVVFFCMSKAKPGVNFTNYNVISSCIYNEFIFLEADTLKNIFES